MSDKDHLSHYKHAERIYPKLHKDIPMGSRVRVKDNSVPAFCRFDTGEVQGISGTDVFFTYIIYLDRPRDSRFGLSKCVTLPGTCLEGENGESFDLEAA